MWTHEKASLVALYTLRWRTMGLKTGYTSSKDQCCYRRSPQACDPRTLYLQGLDPGHQRGRGRERRQRSKPANIGVVWQRADAPTVNPKPYTLHLQGLDPGHQRGRGGERGRRLQCREISVVRQRADGLILNPRPYISRVWIQDTSAGAAGSAGGASSAATSV